MKLVFRKIKDEDLEMILNWRTMPEVSSYMYTDFEPSMERQRKWFKRINVDSTRLDWIINADGEDVGLVSLTNIDSINRRCDWGCYLGSPNVRGKGIGKSVELSLHAFVFETLGLNKFCCEVFVSNQKVISFHEKLGSVVEGTRREQIHKNGEFYDIVEMGLLRNDWERNLKGTFEYTAVRIESLGKEVVGE